MLTPNPARRTVAPAMAARGMRPAAELAAGKPCGTRVRYYAGCRCEECRRANREYERERLERLARGETNRLVSPERARAHLRWLAARGVGRQYAADAAKVPVSTIGRILNRETYHIRERTERRILAVTPAAAADRARIDAGPTWRLIDELLACGYSKRRVASEIHGRPVLALQLSRDRVTVLNAYRVRRVHERLRYATAAATARAERRMAELLEEGFLRPRVLREVQALAAARGCPVPTLERAEKGARAGCLRRQEVELVAEVHAALLGGAE